jgi:predicted ArsR family transcriptional regulator
MSEPVELDERTHGLGPTRARVLALLQDAGEALTAAEVGERLGMHANSARFHLDALAAGGLVLREAEARTSRGRPRMLYAAGSPSPFVARRRYRLLAEMLASFVHEQVPDAAAAAEEAGRRMAVPLAAAGPAGPADESDFEALVATLDEVGFDSHVVEDEDSLRVEISHCPFLEVADVHRDVVCAMHLGLLRGVLEQRDTAVEVRDLQPLVEPSRCVAHLSR